MTSPISAMLTGVAQLLDAAGVGSWSPSAVTANPWPIAIATTPPNADQAITLTDYALSADPLLSDRLIGLNVRIRGGAAPATARDRAELVYGVLQGFRGALPNGQRVVQVYWQSEIQVGPDANGRHVRSVNYYVQMNVAFAGSE